MDTARLITIPFSHYCEKARWALDRCRIDYREDGHLPLLHWVPARQAGGGRTVPVLIAIDGEVVADSTDIIRWAEREAPAGLLPEDPAQRAEVDELEDYLDEVLGPHSRRWGYHQVLADRGLALEMARHGVPGWERRALAVLRPLVAAMLRLGMNITAETAERSRGRVDEAFDRIAERLAGRRYLVGDRFTAADLTFAALAAPAVFPDGHPWPFPPLHRFPASTGVVVEAWREHPAGRFAQRLYAEERRD